MLRLGPYQLANPWILAPMAGVSEMPYRRIARSMGAAAAPTELISAKGLLYGQSRTERYLRHHADEAPFWVQIFGGEPEVMAAGAERAAELGAHILDVNMGCPVKKVTRNGAGSALLTDPRRAAAVVEAMVRRTGLPVTVKIRSGWDANSINAVELARAVAGAGAVAIAVHARTRTQGYSGQADWGLIRHLVQQSPIPVIGNGDAYTAARARAMLQETGCAAVMIGRGALGNPWLFRELATGEKAPGPGARWTVIRQHLEAHLEHTGDELQAIRRFRQHLAWYVHGLNGAARFRQQAFHIDSLPLLLEAGAAFFESAQLAPGADSEAFLRAYDTRKALG